MRDETRDIPEIRPDLCVIGLEPAGFEIAFGAAALGVPVALLTQRSIAAALAPGMPDPVKRLGALGVQVIEGEGQFQSPRIVSTQNARIRARRFVVATGALPARPAIEGIGDLPAFDAANAAGAHLVVFGTGAAGVALAQRARGAGARVTMLAETAFLPGFDLDGASILRTHLEREGIAIRLPVDFGSATLVAVEEGQHRLAFGDGSGPVTFTHAAFDCGLVPAIAGLGFDRAGIALRDGLPITNSAMRTSNRRVYIAGSAQGRAGADLRAGAEAAAILKEVLFRSSGAMEASLAPRLVATRPTLAEFGLSEGEIPPGERARHRFLRVPLDHGGGHIKAITTQKGAIRGASILAENAGELLATLMLAAERSVPVQSLAGLPLPGGTGAAAFRALGALALRDRLRSPGSARLIRFLRWFG